MPKVKEFVPLTPEESAAKIKEKQTGIRKASLIKAHAVKKQRAEERRIKKEQDLIRLQEYQKELEGKLKDLEKRSIGRGDKAEIRADIIKAYYDLGGRQGLIDFVKNNEKHGFFYEKILVPLLKIEAEEGGAGAGGIQVFIGLKSEEKAIVKVKTAEGELTVT